MKLSFVQMPFYTVFKYKNVFPTVDGGNRTQQLESRINTGVVNTQNR